MRYLTILLAVVALAFAAGTAQAQCPDADSAYAEDCGDLPVYGGEINREECTVVFWKLYFTRTSMSLGHCVVKAKIANTSCDISIDSGDYSSGSDSLSGACVIYGTPIKGRMEHHPIWDTDGLFSDLKFIYNTR